jgi:ABC-type oligopeptide transport system substrate-binding subunit/class 3 adenylate cyclase
MTTQMPEERRVITVLFADLVGSTAIGERLDPEETRFVVADAIRRIVEAVEAFGGHVKDLAGDGVLAFFGAPVAHEDDAERGILAGLRVTSAIEAYAREVEMAWGISGFGVRVGVNTGPVVLGEIGGGSRVEYAAFGDAVNVAARLQSEADPGTVLVADATRRVVDVRFEWAERRELGLKGRDTAVTASVARRAVAGAAPPASALTTLVGRERELDTLGEAVERVAEGTGGVVLVTGEAGIGKSRLLLELRRRFVELDSPIGSPAWLEGRCVSYGESLSYWPFRDLLRGWIGVDPDDPELRVRLALRRRVTELFADETPEIYPYLGRLLDLALEPEAAARVGELSPEAIQYRTFEVIRTLVARLAARGPVALVIDDLHWADATSLQLAASLLGMTDEAAVLLVFAMRSERDRPAWHVRDQAATEVPHRMTELALAALGADAERRLLDELVGRDTLPPDIERRLLEEAEGNPFFLEELVRSIADAGALRRTDDGWAFDHEVELIVPSTVEQVILARIARLGPDARRVITAAAVLGRTFSLPLLEHVVEGDGVQATLTELQRLDLLRENRRWPQPEYRFKHALIQEAAYGTILMTNRRVLHRRAAEWLEARRAEGGEAPLGLLAHHWLGAEDEEQAIRALTLAGDHARQTWSLDEAVDHYQALLHLLERREERQGMALVLFKLALALHNALRFAEANAAYQRAFELWESPAPPARVDERLRVAALIVPSQPDPPRSYNLGDIRLQMALFDRLVERWPESTIVPSLAEHWEVSDDGLRYRFRLREGLKWSDGQPITASDVEFAVRRNVDPERPAVSAGIYHVIEGGRDFQLRQHKDPARIGVEAIDDRTVEFRLAAPAPYFMSVVNRPDSGPHPRHAIDRHGDAWLAPENQVVSGAFEQVERTAERVELVRRPGYGGARRGNVERVTIAPMTFSQMLEAYRRDELDLLDPRTARLSELNDWERKELILGPPAYLISVAFDFSDPVAGNLDMRRALAHAIDRAALDLAVSGGPHASLSVATGGIVPPALQGHTPEIALRYDPDLARDLVLRSGVDRIRVAVPEVNEEMRLVTDAWAEVLPIAVERVEVSAEQWRRAGSSFDFAPIGPHGWFPGYPDPEYFLRLLLHSDSHDITDRPEQRYRSAAFDDLIERARQERDGPKRLELFHTADRLAVTEDVALIPAFYGRNVYLVKPWVRGWWEFGKSWSSFADLSVDPDARS